MTFIRPDRNNIKAIIKSKYPSWVRFYHWLRSLPYRSRRMKSIFIEHYQSRVASGEESLSGSGSSLGQTIEIRMRIPVLVREFNASSMLDAPCGDFHWLKEVELELQRYVGVDIVPDIIRMNQQRYGNHIRQFRLLDITKDELPRSDIILCRECLGHFSFKKMVATLRNFKRSESSYLLTTTYPQRDKNRDILTGHWRPINLELPPFDFPTPIKMINEKCTEEEGGGSDKSLGFWRLEDIPF